MSRTLNIRLEDQLLEALRAAAEEEDRSLNNYIARVLAEAIRLREGHSTLGSTPGASPGRKSMKSVSKRPVKKGAPLAVVRDTAQDRLEGQKVIDRVTKARAQKSARPEPEPVQEEDEAEYFARIQRENTQKAQGVGPEPWS